VDNVAGAGFEAPTLTAKPGTGEKRFAASVVERGAAKLAGAEAYAATIDVANVDQLRLTPNAREARVRLVIARAPYRFTPSSPYDMVSFPVLMVAEYASAPDDYDHDLPDFDDLLGRISMGGSKGFSVTANESSPAAPAAPAKSETPA